MGASNAGNAKEQMQDLSGEVTKDDSGSKMELPNSRIRRLDTE